MTTLSNSSPSKTTKPLSTTLSFNTARLKKRLGLLFSRLGR